MNPASAPTVRVLLVEDNRADTRLLGMAFAQESGWPVELDVVQDGEHALAFLGATLPDLLILDLKLPRYDAIEILKIIRADTRLKDLPVVLLSSLSRQVIEARVREAGVMPDAYFTKPFDVDEFLSLGGVLHRFYDSLVLEPDRVPALL